MKKLYRSRKNKVIAGVCGGLGEYFNIDPVVIRIIAVILFLWGGSGILAYIIAWIIIPWEEEIISDKKPKTKEEKSVKKKEAVSSGDSGILIIGVILIVIGALFLMRNFPFFDGYYWWVKHQLRLIFWPGILILIGIFMIFRSLKK